MQQCGKRYFPGALRWALLFCRYEWTKDGFGDLLMLALPHHMDTMGADVAVVMEEGYQSMKVRRERVRWE